MFTTDRILDLINSPGYSSLPDTRAQISEASDPVRRLLKNIPEGYNVSRDLGLYTFAPTLDVYRNFSRFLAVVEEIGGRELGVVRIIVPKNRYVKTTNRPWVLKVMSHKNMLISPI